MTDVRLFVGVPLASAQWHFATSTAVMSLAERWPVRCEAIRGCHIPHNRAHLVQYFLDRMPEATHLLFVDSDMGFGRHQVQLLLDADVDVIGALYVIKNDRPMPCYSPLPDVGPEALPVLEVRRVGTGLMLIQRHVLERMVQHYEELRMKHGGQTICDLFSPPPGTAVTDDYAFCDRWTAMGGKVHVHTDARCNHFGPDVWGVPPDLDLPGISK